MYLVDGKNSILVNQPTEKELKNAKVVEICNFIDGIRRVYSFSNLNDFFKMDIPNIKSILEAIDINELSKEKRLGR